MDAPRPQPDPPAPAEPLEAFFGGLPTADSMAFVVVLHLDPDQESQLAEVIGTSTALPVETVTEPVRIEPGHVYVVPPGSNLTVEAGVIRPTPIEDERLRRRPVDHLFRTLAEAWGDRAVAVVLSGTGSNGTVGAGLIKERGGLVLAQDPADALHAEMPQSAVADGVADRALPAADLGARLAERLGHLRQTDGLDEGALDADGVEAFRSVLAHLRVRTGHDFAHYKRSTVLRRLARRLHVTGADTLDAYLERLRADPDEPRALLGDLLISVTSFFRDPGAFEALAREGIPRLFEGKTDDDEVRVWVPGCATGEEAYTLAILLDEHASGLDEPPAFQVFATDLSEAAVRAAREGRYPGSIEADVSPERLRRYFWKEDGAYRVREDLRERVLFAPHGLLTDPPFSRVDLVSCRNLLIYLRRGLQRRVLELFHYALRPGGVLFLGSAESTDRAPGLYETLDKGARLYRRREVEAPPPRLPGRQRRRAPALPDPAAEPAPADPRDVASLLQRLQAEAAPPGLLLDERRDVLQLTESADPYLHFAGGVPTQNALRMVRPELQTALQTALFQAERSAAPVVSAPVEVDVGGEARHVRVHVRPAPGGLVHVVFEAVPAEAAVEAAAAAGGAPDADSQALRDELQETQETLQLVVEEYETSREELRAQNEELRSINEELRSTGEELERAKGEAQSAAVELRTVNGELETMRFSTEIATLFLDRELRIQRFTPRVEDHLRVLPSDLGRPLADLADRLDGASLAADAEAVLETLEVREREVQDEGGRWFLVLLRPYRTVDDRIEGVVVTFVNITERQRAEEALREREERQTFLLRLSDALRAEPSADAVADRALRMLSEQMGLDRCWISEVSEQEGVSRVGPERLRPDLPPMSGVYQLSDYPETMRQIATRPVAVQDAAGDPRFSDSERERLAGLHLRALLVAPLREGERRVVWALAAATDTPRRWTDSERVLLEGVAERTWAAVERARAEEGLRESGRLARERLDELEATYAAAPVGLCVLDRDLRYRRINRRLAEINGRSVEEHLGRTVREVVPDLADAVEPVLRQIFETGEPVLDIEITGETAARPGVERVWVESWLPLRDAAGEVVGINVVAEEVTERKRTEAALRESEGRFRTLAETVPDAVFTTTADGAVDYVNRQHTVFTGTEPDEVLGTTMWPDLVHPDDREAAEAAWEAARQNAERFEARYRLCNRAADAYCWVIVRARPVFDDDGALAKWFGAVTDVDALARAEEEVRQLNATLECRVDERTREVRRLAARLTTAEQDERERIARVLHDDLQQQLVGLSMTLDLLRRPAAPGGDATDEAERLHDQADEILGHSIDTARTLAAELSPAVLESTRVEDLLTWIALRKEGQHGMEIEIEVEGPCEVVEKALRVVLSQAVQEALLNVVKHAGTTRAALRAWTDEGLATVQIADEGDGFDPHRQRAEAGGFGGTGLGLPHVRERVERAGGWLAVDSAPGQGTRLTVAVPAGAPDDGP